MASHDLALSLKLVSISIQGGSIASKRRHVNQFRLNLSIDDMLLLTENPIRRWWAKYPNIWCHNASISGRYLKFFRSDESRSRAGQGRIHWASLILSIFPSCEVFRKKTHVILGFSASWVWNLVTFLSCLLFHTVTMMAQRNRSRLIACRGEFAAENRSAFKAICLTPTTKSQLACHQEAFSREWRGVEEILRSCKRIWKLKPRLEGCKF